MRKLVAEISRSLQKSSPISKLSLPDVVQHMLAPVQNLEKLNQSEIDICKGNVLIKYYQWRKEEAFRGYPTQEDIAKFYAEIENIEVSVLKKRLNEAISEQVEELFENVHQAVEELGSDNPTNNNPESYHNDLLSRLIEKNRFVLETRKSTIPLAGDGLFAKGSVLYPGSVVGIFPGKVHLPQYLTNEYVDAELLPDPHFFLMGRLDGAIIDGRTAMQVPYNPYGLAHMINHPPRNTAPNVLQLTFDFPGDPWGIDEFPKHLQRYIPNTYARPPTLIGTPDRSAMMRTVILMATSPISPGEEIFMDYRLNPEIEAPEWYHQVDEKLSKKRWERSMY